MAIITSAALLVSRLTNLFRVIGRMRMVSILRALFVANPSHLLLNTLLRRMSPWIENTLKYLTSRKIKITPMAFKKPAVFWGRAFNINKTLLSGLTQPPTQFAFNQVNQLFGRMFAEATFKATGRTIQQLSGGKVQHVDLKTIYRFVNNLTQRTRKKIGYYLRKAMSNATPIKVNSSWIEKIIFTWFTKQEKFGFLFFQVKSNQKWYGGSSGLGYPFVPAKTFERMRDESNAGTTWWREYFRMYRRLKITNTEMLARESARKERELARYERALRKSDVERRRQDKLASQQAKSDSRAFNAQLRREQAMKKDFLVWQKVSARTLKTLSKQEALLRWRARKKKFYNRTYMRKGRFATRLKKLEASPGLIYSSPAQSFIKKKFTTRKQHNRARTKVLRKTIFSK